MRILGPEPSLGILSQTFSIKKSWKVMNKKVPKQAKDKGDVVINPKHYNFNQF